MMKKCNLCNASAVLKYKGMKGYLEGDFYDVYECSGCNVSFVDPLKSDEKIYELIYKQAKIFPGYERYYRYSELIKKVKDPLNFLANSESVYWAVRESIIINFPNRKDVRILEIGSGLGYLTYSLNISGYNTIGLDISEDAVKSAKKKYGNYYEACNIFTWAEKNKGSFDCIVMTELIEHVEDPRSFINVARSLLRPNGKLIVTTPNKSASFEGTIWQSDFPPVHLWFFSEKSMLNLASTLNLKCDFVDFTRYTKKFYGPTYTGSIEEIQLGLPRMTKAGVVRDGTGASQTKTKIFGLMGRWYLSYIRRRLKMKIISKQTTTMCAVLYN